MKVKIRKTSDGYWAVAQRKPKEILIWTFANWGDAIDFATSGAIEVDSW